MDTDQNKNDHDLLIELRSEMRGLRVDIKNLQDNVHAQIADHETRIRRLELWGGMGLGGLAILEFISKFLMK